ncbi:AlpA family transcriptional regulator [Paraferrimonas sp. SM1919]|uniref:helix-turn-helix transcriptional regulator n=1 Tax=Paraferrimonas sp. SM1919 TaxID=2662263 RepID=UPI0013D8C8CD|nr:AlpA family phage regulatory protein [Paraferrimonas sp. SM1919]
MISLPQQYTDNPPIDLECTCLLTSLSRTALFNSEKDGSFPKGIHYPDGKRGWWLKDVMSWIDSLERGSLKGACHD